MIPKTYLGIEFTEGYNKPFAEFKKEFETLYIFKNFNPKDRANELKKAYSIAISVATKTKKALKEIEVTDFEIIKPDGNPTRSVEKVKKPNK